ncbi:hypothetical protein, partial [Ruminococcus sp. AM43-6]|uniref:hypothetical protein n=1 Tax=Ruminococcus sp. AM43-6 TaxID=2293216 RepID=UPI001A9A65DF
IIPQKKTAVLLFGKIAAFFSWGLFLQPRFFFYPFFTHTIMRQKNPTVSDNIFSADKTKR